MPFDEHFDGFPTKVCLIKVADLSFTISCPITEFSYVFSSDLTS